MDSSQVSLNSMQKLQEKVNQVAMPSDLKQDILERLEHLHTQYTLEDDTLVAYIG